jgi:hypothetical protein
MFKKVINKMKVKRVYLWQDGKTEKEAIEKIMKGNWNVYAVDNEDV